jgi:hypothetical protein
MAASLCSSAGSIQLGAQVHPTQQHLLHMQQMVQLLNSHPGTLLIQITAVFCYILSVIVSLRTSGAT